MKSLFPTLFLLVAGLCTVPGTALGQDILTLEDCLTIAHARNTRILNAGHQQSISRAGRVTALSNILPSLTTGMSARHTQIGPTANNTQVIAGREFSGSQPARTSNSHSLNFNISQTIYNGGAWWNQLKQSNAQIEASEFNYASTKNDIDMQVKTTFFRLLQDKRQLEVLQETLASRDEQLRRSETMFRVGVVAQVDVFRSRVAVNQIKIAILNQTTVIANARSNLNLVLGRTQGTSIDVAPVEPEVRELAITVAQAIAIARSANPALVSGDYDIQAAQYGVKVAKAGWLPTITARAGYTRNNSDITRVYQSFNENYNWNLNANVSFNLFDGRRTSAAVQRARAQESIARENRRLAEQTIERDVTTAFNNYTTNLIKITLYEDNLIEARETLRLAEGRYQQGAGTLLEIIDAQESLTSARIQTVRARYDSEMFKANIENALGAESESHVLFK